MTAGFTATGHTSMHAVPIPHSETYKNAQLAREYVLANVPGELAKPRVAVVCGSGLGSLAENLFGPKFVIPYSDIPGFVACHIPGHASRLIFAFIGENKVPCMIFAGRFHSYEGHALDVVTFPQRFMKIMGVEVMIATNAAGGLNSNYKVGELMIIKDHINFPGLAGLNPLKGPNLDDFGTRFPPLSDAYDLELRKLVYKAATERDVHRTINEGCYAFVSGPSFETRAEARMLKLLGADCVGMSTVPEVIVARHCGIRVLAISLVTNNVVTEESPSALSTPDADTSIMSKGAANHKEVLEAGLAAAEDMRILVTTVINHL
ncbi:purine nucleoside phosphorylase [Schizosaccharomyces japonicus yFS275]|uniref:Purine nucleoside phosphorylase n=1 Tax=Schizosaccharomyces japonicus (strain yFS275 / FY16936) TaxID=402676 RepID=B6K0G6_SCHJY|nr:purine nucleoside phosphorylase [Schizosaccharomyces japonicus yFS275]EEB06316.1 purine nucleoside phosphorylase [Schizosaccharomyces japonicus yFS275]